MTYSVHVADVDGVRETWRALRGRLADVGGLRNADVGFTVDMGGPMSKPPTLHVKRLAMLAWWEGDDALDAFLSSPGLGQRFENGWHARVEPLRVYNSWTSLPELPAEEIEGDPDEPMLAVTIAHTRLSHLPRFLKTSNPAENLAVESSPMIWGAAFVRLPRTFATLTVWRTLGEMRDYAMGRAGRDHLKAIKEQHRNDFHRESAFIRLRPLSEHGTVDGVALVAEARAQAASA